MRDIPNNIKPKYIVQAINKIEKEGIPPQAHSSSYDVLYNGKRYPPKLVLSYANIFANGVVLDRNEFEGGLNTPCFKILKNNGFEIVTKESIAEMLKLFLEQAVTTKLTTKNYLKNYDGLKVKVSFGQGGVARIPWISFLGDGQTTSEGIFPVFLFYKEYNILVLAYGISETNKPNIEWNIANDVKTIRDYFSQIGVVPDRYGDSFVYKTYDTSDSMNFKSIESDLRNLVYKYKIILKNVENLELKEKQQPFVFSSFMEDLLSTGLIFSDQLVTRFVLSLLTKPFVILTGLSGSGKTQLAISFAKWICENEKQICIVPVGADWTNREFLLGYPNAIEPGKYIKPDNGVLDLILEANKNVNKPYFLILDEMNLSYVERYFADILSAMESGEKIPLMRDSDDVPASIELPRNLFIIGTINVDETTYMFSPKVLDRANVIEFRIMPNEIDIFFQKVSSLNKELVFGKGTMQSEAFVEIANNCIDPQKIEGRGAIVGILKDFFMELKKIHAEFGYRTANEMFRFIGLGQILQTKLNFDMIVDAVIVQKLLPKLHGSRKKVEPILRSLWSLCINDKKQSLEGILEFPDEKNLKYPLSAEKIWRMYRIAQDNGFTSFAEA